MHFYCKCGNRISDITDYISYKAHIIADQDWYDFMDIIVDAIESGKSDRKKLVDEFYRDTCGIDKQMYQCPVCGQIYIDGEGGSLYSFCPEAPVNTNLLQSIKGENWEGYLWAEWKDKKSEWSEHHGYIQPMVNGDYKSTDWDDYNEFLKEYYRLFEELKEKQILRHATMKCNKKVIHDWSEKDCK